MAPQASLSVATLRPPSRRSLPQAVTGQLLRLIGSADETEVGLPSERSLSERLGVSRNVVRESLAALEHLGVVTKRGTKRVGLSAQLRAQLIASAAGTEAERELLTDPMEVRRILEPEVAAIAATRIDDQGLRKVERWLSLMREGVARGERIVEYDSAFHVEIARVSGNQMLERLVRALTESLESSRERSFEASGAAETAVENHQEILDALRRHAPEDARAAMIDHLDRVEGLIRSTLPSGTSLVSES